MGCTSCSSSGVSVTSTQSKDASTVSEDSSLLDDGENLADQLRDAGVAVKQKTYAGVTDEFSGTKAVLPEAQAALTYTDSRVAQSF